MISENMVPQERPWPRWAVAPDGSRAIFDCWGDVPLQWRLEEPLPGMDVKELPKPPKPKKAA